MSKASGDLHLREWYAIKHALEDKIQRSEAELTLFDYDEHSENIIRLKKDIEQEKKIVNKIVDIISKYQKTEEHYSEDKSRYEMLKRMMRTYGDFDNNYD